MSGFSKLFSSIVTSTVWVEDDKTLRTWIAMLALSNASGFVEGSIPGFASLCRMSVEDMQKSIGVLLAPDKFSRSKAHDGRRIEERPGGWLILNYEEYRNKGQDKQGSRAAYMREYRNSSHVTGVTPNESPVRTEAEAEAELLLSPNGDSVACPHQKIIAEYHDILPTLPSVRVWTESRKKLLSARWREDKERQSMDFWRQYFRYVAASDFLMGRTGKFEASLPWLLKAENFAKVIEGNYDNRNKP